jgi:hypothetical protein
VFCNLTEEPTSMSMTFQERNEALHKAEAAILEEVTHPMTAGELVRSLKPRIADEYSIRAAIWFLIGRGALEIRRENNAVLVAKV